MAIRVRGDSLRAFLADRADDIERRPAAKSAGLCILSGQLVRQNLEEHLDKEGIAFAPLVDFTTVESLSGELLAAADRPDQMLADSVRDRLVEEIFRAGDPSMMDASVELDPDDILREKERKAIRDLADRLPYEEDEVREAFITELDDYYRWTDAATDLTPAMRELGALENQFAQLQSNRSMKAFRGVERLIESRLGELTRDEYQSRSHLVHAAREEIEEQWRREFSHVDWITVAGISVFDNPTIRFLGALADSAEAPDVHVFLNRGSLNYNIARFEAMSVETLSPDSWDVDDHSFDSSAAQELFRATTAAPEEIPEPVTFLEAPTDQRAVERIATEIRDLLRSDVEAGDILIIAPNAGNYKSLVEHAFETVELPVHVETRRPYANVPAYRFLQAFITVIDALDKGEPLTYDELSDPLRLGYCPRDGVGSTWPLDGRAFTKIEQELHRKQQFYNRDPDRYEDQGIPFDIWEDLIDEIPGWTGQWWAVKKYLDDVRSLVDEVPQTGEDLVALLESYLGRYVYQTVDHKRALYEGPAVDTTRSSLSETHPTNQAERIRSELDRVGSYYDRIRQLFDVSGDWDEISRALSTGLGSGSYGEMHLDQHAIPVVDAGNAYFRDAKYIYFLGMDADTFPGEAPTATFLHNEIRQAVYDSAVSGETPYHHLDSRATGYREAVDFYQAGLMAASEDAEITLCHTYQDERGNSKAWSPFVDLFDLKEDEDLVDRPVDRVEVGDWLPNPRSKSESWGEVVDRVAPRERLRTLLYQSYRDYPDSDPALTVEDLQNIYQYIPQDALNNLILPRLRRYHTPPTSVTVSPNEPAFDEVSLGQVTGSPHQPHELDLQAQCGLKYYYYQFFYNFTGEAPTRAEIPKYYASSPHWRLGELPYIVRENYADPRYVEKWQRIVEDLLSDRQSRTTGVAQFESAQDVREWVADHELFDDYDKNTIVPNLIAERELVERELQHGVTREWHWREGGTIQINNEELQVPAYRVDSVHEGGSAYRVPIFFTRFSRRARSAMKACFQGGNIWSFEERDGSLCIQCGKDGCTYHSKYVIDHRMLVGYRHEEETNDASVVGIGLQEQYAGPSIDDGERVIAMRTGITDKFQPNGSFEDPIFEVLAIRGYKSDWTDAVSDWEAGATTLIDDRDTETAVEFEANTRLVQDDDCLTCVYRDLCRVPDRDVIDE
jgi:ATP-dependent helicase/nuclease subunit B